MGIRSGEPQPMTAMVVGMGRERSVSGVRSWVMVRRYSWQLPQKKCRTKITRTLRATHCAEYTLRKGTDVPSARKTFKSAAASSSAADGRSMVFLLVFVVDIVVVEASRGSRPGAKEPTCS